MSRALNVTEVTDKLGLHERCDFNWHVQGSNSISGDGIHEGLDWLSDQLKGGEKKKKSKCRVSRFDIIMHFNNIFSLAAHAAPSPGTSSAASSAPSGQPGMCHHFVLN